MTFRTQPLGALGVEIDGLDLRQEIPDGTWARLRSTIMEQGLVLFRGQPLACAEHVRLGQRLGELENTSADQAPLEESEFLLSNVGPSGEILPEEHTEMHLVAINEGWHTDSSFRDIPASFSLFSALQVPEEGGDTFFASLRLGWEALRPSEQTALFGRFAVHDYDRAYRTRAVDMDAVFGGPAPSARHPLVRKHPETGATSLYLSEHMYEIEGMGHEESKRWIDRLLGVCTAPERIYRHAWSEGDLVIWDNRSMLHRAQGFDPRYARVMRHVRVGGTEAAIPASA